MTVKRVYRLSAATNEYQSLLVDSDDPALVRSVELWGIPQGESWSPPPLYVDHHRLKRPDIMRLSGSALVLSPHALKILLEEDVIAEQELLPLDIEGEPWTVLNVTAFTNWINVEASEWLGPTMPIVRVFHPHRLGEPSLFHIEQNGLPIYCWDADNDPEFGFRNAILRNGLTGLIFEEVWNSLDGGKRLL